MGARLWTARWFRDSAQIEHRMFIMNATSTELDKRVRDLELVGRISFLSIESVLELWRVREAAELRYREMSWRMPCPQCGGWAYCQYGLCGMVPLCRECGWPRQIHVSNPRTAYRLTGDRF